MNRLPIASVCLSAFCLMLGCSSKPATEGSLDVSLTYQQVQDPLRELCTDDTFSRTDYINVPLVRFVGTAIELNGLAVSEQQLLHWAEENYKNLAEQVLWVQISPESRSVAEGTLLPLVKTLPRLQLRRVDPEFTCPSRPMCRMHRSRQPTTFNECAPKLIGQPTFPKRSAFHVRKGEKFTGYPPVISFHVLESGTVTDVVVKRSSGISDLDSHALASVRGFKYNRRPGCGVIESDAVVLIHFSLP